MKLPKTTLFWLIGVALPLSVLSANLDIKTPEISFFVLTREDTIPHYCHLDTVICENQFYADVSAYNTVEAQTDNTPCISASGDNICGRDDVVACPRRFPLGTNFEILGKDYICLDRLSLKYDNRIDISFDKDIQGAINFGVKNLKIIINK